jgi:precorrin-6x reductase
LFRNYKGDTVETTAGGEEVVVPQGYFEERWRRVLEEKEDWKEVRERPAIIKTANTAKRRIVCMTGRKDWKQGLEGRRNDRVKKKRRERVGGC